MYAICVHMFDCDLVAYGITKFITIIKILKLSGGDKRIFVLTNCLIF